MSGDGPGGGAGQPLRPGDPVHCRFTKWPGLPHWQHDKVWLGRDEQGDWLGQRAGARSRRPGAAFANPVANVSLVPRGDPTWVASASRPDTPWAPGSTST